MLNDSYNYAGGCGVLHPFNKTKREECEKANLSSPKAVQAQSDLILAQAAALKASQPETNDSWSPLAITGVIIGSLAAITIMVLVIKKMKKK